MNHRIDNSPAELRVVAPVCGAEVAEPPISRVVFGVGPGRRASGLRTMTWMPKRDAPCQVAGVKD